jgi:ArsR family transcriptional regulator
MNSTQVVSALSALAHEYRLGIYRMLVEAGPEGLNAGTIAARLKLPPSSLTFHIQNLHRAGLLTQARKGRELIYAADFDAMNTLVAYLTDNCCSAATSSCKSECEPPRVSKKAAKRTSRAA